MAEGILTRKPKNNSQVFLSGKFLMVVSIVLFIILLSYACITLLFLPKLRITRVLVEADFRMSRNTVLQQAGLTETSYFHTVQKDAIIERLMQNYQIRTAKVEKVFPNTIRLLLTRRRPLFMVFVNYDNKNIPAVVDETGVVFDAGIHVADNDLLLLSGIEIPQDVLGEKLPSRFDAFLHSVYNLRIQEPALYNAVSELSIDSKPSGHFDILLYTKTGSFPIRLPEILTSDLCKSAVMIAGILMEQHGSENVLEVDLRTGEVVYRMKEEII